MRLCMAFGPAIWALALIGCSMSEDAGAGDLDYMPDDVPSGGRCDTGGAIESTSTGCAAGDDMPDDGAAGSSCQQSGECDAGLVCAAPFDRGERGAYACVEACISIMDEFRWCADASACCEPEAQCTTRGYCILPESGTTTDATSDETTADGETSTGDESGDTTTTGRAG